MTWKDSFISVDTETTGFLSSSRVIEIGFAWFEQGKITRVFSTLLNPGPLDLQSPDVRHAFEINKINPERLKDAPTFDELLRGFFVKIGREAWVGHNLEYDLRMLSQERKLLEEKTRQNWQSFIPKPIAKLDTMHLAHHLRPGIDSYKLQTVAETLGIEWPATHRALDDCRACGQVLLALADDLPDDVHELAVLQKAAKKGWDARKKKG